MAHSKGYDKLLFVIGSHRVMYDRLQIVIQHPIACHAKGSPHDDVRKTFHPLKLAFQQLTNCGENLTSSEKNQLQEIGQEVAKAIR